jgi:hypothetical protein
MPAGLHLQNVSGLANTCRLFSIKAGECRREYMDLVGFNTHSRPQGRETLAIPCRQRQCLRRMQEELHEPVGSRFKSGPCAKARGSLIR